MPTGGAVAQVRLERSFLGLDQTRVVLELGGPGNFGRGGEERQRQVDRVRQQVLVHLANLGVVREPDVWFTSILTGKTKNLWTHCFFFDNIGAPYH